MPVKAETKSDTKETAAAKAGILKDKNLASAVAAIQKQYGDGSIMRLGDATAHVDIQVIPTGALVIGSGAGGGGDLPAGGSRKFTVRKAAARRRCA